MWNLVKIPVEPLVPETFAPFGHVIRTFEERKPDKVKGGYATNAYPVLATPGSEPKDGPGWYAPHPQRVPISEGAGARPFCLSHRRRPIVLPQLALAERVFGRGDPRRHSGRGTARFLLGGRCGRLLAPRGVAHHAHLRRGPRCVSDHARRPRLPSALRGDRLRPRARTVHCAGHGRFQGGLSRCDELVKSVFGVNYGMNARLRTKKEHDDGNGTTHGRRGRYG